MQCKRWGCEKEFSESPERPSGYRGGRYREFCSDACRMAEKRRVKAIADLNLSLDENVFFQETIAILLKKYQDSYYFKRAYSAKIHTTAYKLAIREVEYKRKYPNWKRII